MNDETKEPNEFLLKIIEKLADRLSKSGDPHYALTKALDVLTRVLAKREGVEVK